MARFEAEQSTPVASKPLRAEDAGGGGAAPTRMPFLALQGIDPGQRGALLRSALVALQSALEGFPVEEKEGRLDVSGSWEDRVDDFLAECGRAAAADWLGYVPPLFALDQADEGGAPAPRGRHARRWAHLGFRVLLEERFALYGTTLLFLRGGGASPAGLTGAWRSAVEEVEENLPFVLQDLVVTIAETVAAAYLDEGVQALPSAGGAVAVAGSSPRFLNRQLSSTRRVERFRNQVMLRRWVYRNWFSVVAMFEDRQEVWTLEGGNEGGRLGRRQLRLKRSEEFRLLRGVQAWSGLWLETWDVAGPVVQRALAYLTRAVSFLLVSLIGQGLGLVYRGVQQSLRGQSGQGGASRGPVMGRSKGQGGSKQEGDAGGKPPPPDEFVLAWG